MLTNRRARVLYKLTPWDYLWSLFLCGTFAAVGEYLVYMVLSQPLWPWLLTVPVILAMEYASMWTLSAPSFSRRGFLVIYDIFLVLVVAVGLLTVHHDALGVTVVAVATASVSALLGVVGSLGAVVSVVRPGRRY